MWKKNETNLILSEWKRFIISSSKYCVNFLMEIVCLFFFSCLKYISDTVFLFVCFLSILAVQTNNIKESRIKNNLFFFGIRNRQCTWLLKSTATKIPKILSCDTVLWSSLVDDDQQNSILFFSRQHPHWPFYGFC